MKMKNITKRIWYGIRSGWAIPQFPDHILKIEKNIFVRIFKLIGAFFVYILVTGLGQKLEYIYYYIISLTSTLFLIYRLVLTFYMYKQYIQNLRTGKFIVRK